MEWLKEKIKKYENDTEFLSEQLIIDFSELVVMKMQEQKLKRVDLAERLNVSKSFITKILNGNPNMTVKTMVSIANALNCNLWVDLYPKGFEIKRKAIYVYSEENPNILIPTSCEVVAHASNA
jgi:transcriptional regulator with XRE-family HTH domain